MRESMERAAAVVLDRLLEAGHEAYYVGGYVRDCQLGRPVKDIDIATSALPEQTQALFGHTVPTGLKHGTVTVFVDGWPLEVTTFRAESGYEGHRRPTRVDFISSLEEDLSRRDFTLNAMAMDRAGRVIDPFGGLADVADGLLRCVGDAAARFGEDALRMLRCVRFAAEYALRVEARTWQALLERRPLMRHVAMERVRAELERMIAGSDPLRALELLSESGLLRHAKRPLPLPGWPPARIRAELGGLPRLAADRHRWQLLCLAAGLPPEDAAAALGALAFPRKRVDDVRRLLAFDAAVTAAGTRQDAPDGKHAGAHEKAHADALPVAPAGAQAADNGRLADRWKLAVLRFGPETAADWLQVAAQLAERPDGGDGERRKLLPNGERWTAGMPVRSADELALKGARLIRTSGRPPGPWVGDVLQRLLEDAALGRCANEAEELLRQAEDYIQRYDRNE